MDVSLLQGNKEGPEPNDYGASEGLEALGEDAAQRGINDGLPISTD
jgi:hypothetical protein